MNFKNLPEKEYFSTDELAVRWGCERDRVEYYLCEGTLRQAFDTRHLDFVHVGLSNYINIDSSHNDFFYGYKQGLFKTGKQKKAYYSALIREHPHFLMEYWQQDCPRFLYVSNDDSRLDRFHGGGIQERVNNFEPDGKLDCLGYCFNFEGQPMIPLELDASGSWIFTELGLPYDWESQLVIPREERDRFESEHKIGEDKKSASIGGLELSSKTKNHYLRVILNLSEALYGGTIEQPHKAEGAILEILGEKASFEEGTLARYLKEAKKLMD